MSNRVQKKTLVWRSVNSAKPDEFAAIVVKFDNEQEAAVAATYDEILDRFFDENYNDFLLRPCWWAYADTF